jgi:hypothetical protein
MRFRKSGGKIPHQVDPGRRLAHAQRHVAKQKEKLGFLADVIPVESAEDRVIRLNESNVTAAARWRSHLASQWRLARRILRSLDPERRAALLAEWNAAPYPASSEYLLSLLHTRGVDTIAWRLRA